MTEMTEAESMLHYERMAQYRDAHNGSCRDCFEGNHSACDDYDCECCYAHK